MKSITIIKINKFKLSFAWYDLWIGAYIDKDNKNLYICIIPTILITINL
ncbi:MAG TPA: hypothetical protein PLD95_03800 [bacterium]|jgi:hypothetical protein|nr:hypothetical protein [bacterium]HOG38566.1 hypothetical protein [bacterium]HQI03432.1 hypothetical protein [bacterium]